MDDFLWNCAMEASEDSRFDIIPDFQDDMRQFGSEKDGNAQPDQVFILQPDSSSGDIAVQIIESRDYGVLDIIGGELWEGALLLCAYILMHKENFLGHDVLELGSGVGLPGLLLAALKARRADSQVASSVILSDNDPRVVRNLSTAITSQFPLASHHGMNRTGTQIITKQLDWSIFTPMRTEVEMTLSEESLGEAARQILEDTRDRSEVIMGCELCYAPYHARCLAELLRCYLLRGYCKKVVIVQMRDREGFAELQRNLRSYSIPYAIDEIPAELYELAQRITFYMGHSVTGAAQNIRQYTAASAVAMPSEGTSKTYVFTEALLGLGSSGGGNDAQGGALLHTAKENFVILSIDAARLFKVQ